MISETELAAIRLTLKRLPHMRLNCFYILCHCAVKHHFDYLCTERFITNYCGSNFLHHFVLASMHGVKYILIVGTLDFMIIAIVIMSKISGSKIIYLRLSSHFVQNEAS